MSLAFLIFLAAVAAIVIFVIVSYNRLVSLSQRTQSAWSDVDVQLKRRTDLVPIEIFPSNLVAGLFQFREHAYFELHRPGERQVPKVSFGA